MLRKKLARGFLLGLAMVFLAGSVSFQRVAAEELTVSAQSAILMAGRSGTILYEKDAHSRRPMASTTKIMTALLTLEEAERLGDPVVSITEEMVAVEGSSMGLHPGDEISLKNLAVGMLLASGNDAANAAALYLDGSLDLFVDRMNSRADQLGMEDTHFVTPSGLDGEDGEGHGHYSTVYDMALLAQEALQNDAFREICSSSSRSVTFSQPPKQVTYTNHNKLLTQYEGCLGVKTGYTKKAGRCLVSAAEREGVLLIAVTLNAPDDWKDHTALLDQGFSQVESFQADAEEISISVPVVGSDRDSVQVLGIGTADVPVLPGEPICQRICAPAFLYAPVKAGDQVGEVRWYSNDALLATLPLIASQTVEIEESSSGFWERLWGKKP